MKVESNRPYLVMVESDTKTFPSLVALEPSFEALDPAEKQWALTFDDTERLRTFTGKIKQNDEFKLVILAHPSPVKNLRVTVLPLTEARFKEHLASRNPLFPDVATVIKFHNNLNAGSSDFVPTVPFEEETK